MPTSDPVKSYYIPEAEFLGTLNKLLSADGEGEVYSLSLTNRHLPSKEIVYLAHDPLRRRYVIHLKGGDGVGGDQLPEPKYLEADLRRIDLEAIYRRGGDDYRGGIGNMPRDLHHGRGNVSGGIEDRQLRQTPSAVLGLDVDVIAGRTPQPSPAKSEVPTPSLWNRNDDCSAYATGRIGPIGVYAALVDAKLAESLDVAGLLVADGRVSIDGVVVGQKTVVVGQKTVVVTIRQGGVLRVAPVKVPPLPPGPDETATVYDWSVLYNTETAAGKALNTAIWERLEPRGDWREAKVSRRFGPVTVGQAVVCAGLVGSRAEADGLIRDMRVMIDSVYYSSSADVVVIPAGSVLRIAPTPLSAVAAWREADSQPPGIDKALNAANTAVWSAVAPNAAEAMRQFGPISVRAALVSAGLAYSGPGADVLVGDGRVTIDGIPLDDPAAQIVVARGGVLRVLPSKTV